MEASNGSLNTIGREGGGLAESDVDLAAGDSTEASLAAEELGVEPADGGTIKSPSASNGSSVRGAELDEIDTRVNADETSSVSKLPIDNGEDGRIRAGCGVLATAASDKSAFCLSPGELIALGGAVAAGRPTTKSRHSENDHGFGVGSAERGNTSAGSTCTCTTTSAPCARRSAGTAGLAGVTVLAAAAARGSCGRLATRTTRNRGDRPARVRSRASSRGDGASGASGRRLSDRRVAANSSGNTGGGGNT